MFGEIKFVVGLQVHQMKDDIYITQSKYIKETLKVFGMEDSKPVGIPMFTRHKCSKKENKITYRSMIEKIQYVVHTGPDIALVVDIFVSFSANPKENHMMAIKRIEVTKMI